MGTKWKVAKTKSRKRWVAWRLRGKKKSGMIFENWETAIKYAYLMSRVDRLMKEKSL